MDIDELDIGMEVVVWNPEDDGEDYPEHWNADMADFVGDVVTIADLHRKHDEVWIVEDEGQWVWMANDFDPFCPLSYKDPNVKFKNKKEQERVEKWRADFLAKREERERNRRPLIVFLVVILSLMFVISRHFKF